MDVLYVYLSKVKERIINKQYDNSIASSKGVAISSL